jgi:hypothetical protein
MNARLSKLLDAQRSSNPAALEQLRTQFAHHQMKRASDHAALERLAVRGFLFLALAAPRAMGRARSRRLADR